MSLSVRGLVSVIRSFDAAVISQGVTRRSVYPLVMSDTALYCVTTSHGLQHEPRLLENSATGSVGGKGKGEDALQSEGAEGGG